VTAVWQASLPSTRARKRCLARWVRGLRTI